jgi:enolase
VFHKSTGERRTSEQMVDFWRAWADHYPIISIEDPLDETTGLDGCI